ncbi:hypothetical protein RFI_33724 [Reticulomyxa filosa]|uniref:Uncharacterized protein n=1 Tax=Reticulomyxa filosa TaxID=46433 RepID=X6LP19_RETFI|nr:hypothetical protein RFI_33724 [Reticulomyxa filosa]|eukprot:ETO03678.1 hypothetical protein RFI_33724 [Reticulomyxa filosa]
MKKKKIKEKKKKAKKIKFEIIVYIFYFIEAFPKCNLILESFINSNALERTLKLKKIFIIFVFLFKQFELICCLLFLFLQQLEYVKSTSSEGDGTANEEW